MSRFTRVLLPFAAVLAVAIPAPDSAEPPAGIPWLDKSWEAQKRARESGKPMLVDVWAIWCFPCKEMDQTTYRDPRVIEAAEGFVPVKVDADLHDSFIQRFRVEAYPTVLILDGDGDVVLRMVGKLSADTLLRKLRVVREGFGDYLEQKARQDAPDAMTAVASYLLRVGNDGGAVDHLRRALKLLGRAEPRQREKVELLLVDALLADESVSDAARVLDRLSRRATGREIRAEALARLARLERDRGRARQADKVAKRLRDEYPDLADGLLRVPEAE